MEKNGWREHTMRVGILTISDKGSRGERVDESGPAIREIVERELNAQIVEYKIIPDELPLIAATLQMWADERKIDLILTTGGTGFAPRDTTPEATQQIIDREAPGLAEAMRAESLKKTPHAMLSRGVAGIRGHTLIVNLPGSVKAVRENLAVILPALPHGVALLREVPGEEYRH